MIARDEGDELVFNGDKFFSTGMRTNQLAKSPLRLHRLQMNQPILSPSEANIIICLGGVISDVTVLEGVLEDTEKTHVFAFVSTKHPGISFKGDWDVIGQRLTVRPLKLAP
jgi:hypothetical protein